MPLVAGIAIAAAFVALNYRAYDGFFQDDEIDNLSWAPVLRTRDYVIGFLKPVFDVENFRPPGHLYFGLMGRAFGLDFPPWMTPIFAIHLANAALLFFVMRRLAIGTWHALAGVALFTLSAAAMDAYWKPMYVFDLLCTTFSLASILLYSHRRWVLSFIAFWAAYKSKELAVMLPAGLVAWECWFGERRFARLIPFLAASLSFGAQGLAFNPNKDNAYTFRFTPGALGTTVPFYFRRFLLFRMSGLAVFALGFVRDRRVWFGVTATACFLFTLLFLPGRLFEAYTYLPLSCAVIAIAAAACRFHPAWIWCAIALWMPMNVRWLHREQNEILRNDEAAYAFVGQMQTWVAQNPEVKTLVYDAPPGLYHQWGVTASWNIAHHTLGLPAYYRDWPQAAKALGDGPVAMAAWNKSTNTLSIQIHSPGK